MSNQYTDSQDYDGDEYDISQLRTDLDRSGPSIEGAYGVGYSITPKDASIVVRRIGNQIEYCELIPNPDKEGKWAEANPLVPDYPYVPPADVCLALDFLPIQEDGRGVASSKCIYLGFSV